MASTMLDLLTRQLAGSSMPQLTRQLGTDESTASQAIGGALPVLISALARNASNPRGAGALHKALARDHDGSLLDSLGAYVGAGDTTDGDAILGHVLGKRRSVLEEGLSQQTGLDMNVIQQLLPLLAPIVLAYLGRTQRQQQLDPGGLAGLSAKEQSGVEQAVPAALGGLADLVDADRDGDVSDDAAKLGVNMLGRHLGGRSK